MPTLAISERLVDRPHEHGQLFRNMTDSCPSFTASLHTTDARKLQWQNCDTITPHTNIPPHQSATPIPSSALPKECERKSTKFTLAQKISLLRLATNAALAIECSITLPRRRVREKLAAGRD